MLMKVHTELEPLQRLRAAVPAACHLTLDLLIGTVTMPMDQPACSTAVATLASWLVNYGKEIRYVRPEFQALLDDAQIIATTVTVRISTIVDACFRLIVDGVSAPSWTRRGCAQARG